MEHVIIACLYPYNDHMSSVCKAIEENARYAPPRLQARRRDRRERESTELPENTDASVLDYLPSLVVKFGDDPRTDKGLVFGSNPNCDVVLDHEGVSNIHFSLTFDESNRPIIQDLNSLLGTQVTYNAEGVGFRRDFRWIVGGQDILGRKKNIVIEVAKGMSFQIVVQAHDIESPAYVSGVGRFKQGAATTEALLEELGLSNPPTRGTQTPGTGEIFLEKELGEGSFGVATHLWNVSTGEEHVVKKPHRRAIQNGRVDRDAWRQEAHIMDLVSHPHIVKLIQFLSDPVPELHLEYMPYGSLDDHSDTSYSETFTIMRQCSSALAYLHGQDTPIAHRDIKPANILVKSRSEDGIFVKLADFGIARHGFELSTLCGTYLYLAPEIHSDAQRRARNKKKLGYTTTVDIWSLGVVAYQLLYGLPPYTHNGDGLAWCETVIKELRRNVQRRPTALGSMLVRCMVVLSPRSRCSASECCNVLEEMLTGEENQATFRHALQNDDAEDLSAIPINQPTSTGATTSSYFVRSGAPAPDSLASSSRMTQQHNDESEEPSSSQEGQHFLEPYSDGFNPLYFGSSLASDLGGDNPEDWASQFLQESSENSRAEAADLQARSIPLEIGAADYEEIGADAYEEMAGAALLLQALGQGSRPL